MPSAGKRLLTARGEKGNAVVTKAYKRVSSLWLAAAHFTTPATSLSKGIIHSVFQSC